MKKGNNRGFTLVELIVATAVLVIMAGVMSYSANHIFVNEARKFADEYDALLTQCRVMTLAGAGARTYVELSQDADGDYYGVLYEGGREAGRKKLGSSKVTCTFKITTSSDEIAVSETQSLCIGYQRSTGAFVALDEVLNASGGNANGLLTGNCKQVTIAGRIVITMVPSTGYHKVVK